MTDDNITTLDDRRKPVPTPVALMTLPPPARQADGPFTVTVADQHGKMFEVTFPDYTGELPPNDAVLGSTGCRELLVNLLTGAMRVFLGAR